MLVREVCYKHKWLKQSKSNSLAWIDPCWNFLLSTSVDNLPLVCMLHDLSISLSVSYLYQYTQSFTVFPNYLHNLQMHCIAMVLRSSNLLFTAGEFRIVYRARLTRSTLRKTDCEIVAVKTVKGKYITQPHIDRFIGKGPSGWKYSVALNVWITKFLPKRSNLILSCLALNICILPCQKALIKW